MKDSKAISPLLVRVARLQRARAGQALVGIGLFPGQDSVLDLLMQQDGRTMGELADILQVRPPTISKTIGRLAAQGLLERRSSSEDHRLVRVHLTADGRHRAGSIEAIRDTLEGEITDGLDAKDRRRLRKLLRKVGRNLAGRLGTVDDLTDEIEPDDDH